MTMTMTSLLSVIRGGAASCGRLRSTTSRIIIPSTTLAACDTQRRNFGVGGRRRFYQEVSVEASVAPWEHEGSGTSDNTVASPISAGVDGTQSASGVSLLVRPRSEDETRRLFATTTHDGDAPWYGVALDGRLLRTPLKVPLVVPSLPLALAIAAEWDAQRATLVPAQMPLMTLACTAVDQARPIDDVVAECLPYLDHDTTCHYADPADDRVLYKKQRQYYHPLHTRVAEELARRYGGDDVDDYEPAVAVGAGESIALKGLPHPPPLVAAVTAYLRTLNAWEATCLLGLTREAKSLLTALGVLLSSSSDAPMDPADVVRTARVEEEFQIENWGLVEGGHDYDRLNCSVSVVAATFMVECVRAGSSSSS